MSKNTSVLHGDIVLWQGIESRKKHLLLLYFKPRISRIGTDFDREAGDRQQAQIINREIYEPRESFNPKMQLNWTG
jgi:hypothetical protein